jgi:hypothetical protein
MRHNWFSVKKKKAASLKARFRAQKRWAKDREHREWLNTIDPIRFGGRIVRRIVVIDNESTVRERTFFQFDRACDWKRKLREILGKTPTPQGHATRGDRQ